MCSMIDRFLGDAFLVLSCPFWSTVLHCASRLPVYTLIKLMDRAVNGARFLTRGLFECDITHCRSLAILCMLYKIRCNPVHPLYGALPGPYVPVRVTRGALVAHRFTYAPPRCGTSQHGRSFIPLSVSFWNDLANPIFDGGLSCSIPTMVFYYFSLFLLSVHRLVLWCWGLRTDKVYITLSQPCTADLFYNNNNNKNNNNNNNKSFNATVSVTDRYSHALWSAS